MSKPGGVPPADGTGPEATPGEVTSDTPLDHEQAEKPDGPGEVVAAAPKGGVAAATTKPFRTAAEIAKAIAAVIAWIAKPWIAAGTIVEIVGKAKSAGKTTFISHWIAAILDGKPFLGEPTVKSAVVCLTEQSDVSFREVLRRAGLLGRKDLVVLSHHLVADRTWPDIAKMTVTEAERISAKVIFVDTLNPFAGFIGDAENRAGDAEAAVRAISELACPLGIAVVLVRHERKAPGDVGDAGRGSSAFVGTVDVHISLRELDDPPRSTFRLIRTLGRFDETPAELVIELTTNGYVPHGTIDEMKATVPQQMILEVLPSDAKDGLTLEGVMKNSGHKRTRTQDLLKELSASGDVLRVGSGGKGDAYRYHRLQAAPPAPVVAAATPPLGAAATTDGGDAPDTSSVPNGEEGDSAIPGSASDAAQGSKVGPAGEGSQGASLAEPVDLTDHLPGDASVADFSDFADALVPPELLASADDPRWRLVRAVRKWVDTRYAAGLSTTSDEVCEYLRTEFGIPGKREAFEIVLLGDGVCFRRKTKHLRDGTRCEVLEPLAKHRR